MRLLNRAVEIGADDEAVEIANHEQGWIEQRFAITEKLFVCFVEVLFLALVFPGEAALFPHVGKAALARFAGVGCFAQLEKLGVFDNALLEAEEVRAAGIGFRGRRLAHQTAEVIEVALIGRCFLTRVARPLFLELGGCHLLVRRSIASIA